MFSVSGSFLPFENQTLICRILGPGLHQDEGVYHSLIFPEN